MNRKTTMNRFKIALLCFLFDVVFSLATMAQAPIRTPQETEEVKKAYLKQLEEVEQKRSQQFLSDMKLLCPLIRVDSFKPLLSYQTVPATADISRDIDAARACPEPSVAPADYSLQTSPAPAPKHSWHPTASHLPHNLA